MATKTKQAGEGEPKTPEEAGIGELAEWAGIYEPDPLVAAEIIWRYAAKVLAPRALAQHPTTIERGEDGRYVAWLPNLDPIRNNGLALIVVRLDANEGTGDYTVTLDSTL